MLTVILYFTYLCMYFKILYMLLILIYIQIFFGVCIGLDGPNAHDEPNEKSLRYCIFLTEHRT